MSPVSEKLSPVPLTEQDKELAAQHALLSSLVLAKQEQLKTLQHLSSLESVNLDKLKQDQEEERRQHKIRLTQQQDEHYTQLETQRLALVQQEKALNQRDHNLALWEHDLQEWETKVEPTKEAYAQLSAKALEVEQARIRTSDTEQRASQLEQVGTQRMAEVIAREQAVKELETRHTVLAQELEQRAGELDLQAKQVTQDTATLEHARADLDPHLKALAVREQAVADQQVRAEALQAEVAQQAAENQEKLANLSALASRLDARETVLTELQAQLKALHTQVNLSVTALKAAGQPAPVVPALPEEPPTTVEPTPA